MSGGGVERHNKYTRKLYDTNKYPSLWPFRGVDGEGGNVAEEGTLFGTRHQYLSLRIGPNLLETGKPLSWRECFDFIACQKPRGYIYVSYFFDYDVTMMIRTLPKGIAAKLLKRHLRYTTETSDIGTFTQPVEYDGFQFDYLPHKEFKVRYKGAKHWVVISDVGQFFQSSFLSTLDKWDIGSEEERQHIERGKANRAHFQEFTEETRYYNALECDLLEQLMTKFRSVCEETGYVPKKWQGPGYLASAMLTAHGIPRRDHIDILKNEHFYSLALAGYYGGRFETTLTGPIREPVYQYDINGAYVALLRQLPCLTHGSWLQTKTRPATGLWFGRVKFTHEYKGYLFNLPFRNKLGHITFPQRGIGVYWSTELEAAENAGTQIQFIEGWIYESHCQCRWFDFVDDYYAKRLALGKSARGYVLKLAGNSIYGKLAQSIGYAPWANPVWAGLITAGCRALLINAYSQAPKDCLMLATDGLFMTSKLDLPISKELGEWEYTEHPDGIFIVQPGIYFMGDEVKTRGVERGRIYGMRPDFEAAWEHYFWNDRNVDQVVKVPVVNFITARQAIQRNKWQLAGEWQEDLREIHFDWSNKRAHALIKSYVGKDYIRTLPQRGNPDDESIPYSRMIGGGQIVADQDKWITEGLAEKERYDEQPDWVAPLY